MTLEQKWDAVWPAVCAVVAASDSHAACRSELARLEALERLLGNCRHLSAVAERVVPSSPNPKDAHCE